VDVGNFDYELPAELIAQHPLPRRTGSRLMVLHREGRRWEHRRFRDLAEYLRPGDLLVLNDTRVLAARLVGERDTGGLVRCLLVAEREKGVWHALLGASGRLRRGELVRFGRGIAAELLEHHEEGGWLVRFEPADVRSRLPEIGRAPLPPYIKRPRKEDPYREEDLERYQTVFARTPGAIAAPTAGLHFSRQLLDRLENSSVRLTFITLHVGLGTFLPIKEERVEDHIMHEEWTSVSEDAAEAVRDAKARNGRVVACGTTVVRALESAARDGEMTAFSGVTDLFITPGYQFKAVDALVTNFHLPKSTLLVLVSALAGREFVLDAYREAVRQQYRFYSYGDAMLIL